MRRKSGVSTSMVVRGQRSRMARMVSAKCCAPPSARSSRSTEVTTTCARPKLGGRLADMRGLVRVERARQTGLHVAEGAGARAGVAHDHEGGVLLLPALADIRAAGLLAHRDQAVVAHDLVRVDIAGRHRRLDADPVGLFRRRANPADAPFPDGAGADCSRGRERRPCLYLRLRTRVAPQGRRPRVQRASGPPDRAPDQQEDDGADGGGNQLPQKSGMTSSR